VKRSGKALKPSTTLKIGDTLEVPSSDNAYKRNIEVIQLIDKRVGAPLARKAYLDHTPAEILSEVENRRLANKENRQARKEGDQGRLTKRNRRQWEEGGNKFF
jgi:ribosome-associated heat shock protein Hsp15